jgi:hypothetical protein
MAQQQECHSFTQHSPQDTHKQEVKKMKTENKTNERTTIFGSIVEEMSDDRIKVAYTDATTGETVERVILDTMIHATTSLDDGTTAWMLQDVSIGGTKIRVQNTYQCAIDGAEQQDAADHWREGNFDSTNDDELDDDELDDDELDDEFGDDDYDDSVPVAKDTDIDLADLVEDALIDDANTTGKKKSSGKASAAQRAAKAREALYSKAAKVQEELGMKTGIAQALVQGKRHKDFGAWNYKAQVLSVDVRITDESVKEQAITNFTNDFEGIVDEYGLDEEQTAQLVKDLVGRVEEEGAIGTSHQPMHDGEGNDRVRIIVNPTLAGIDGHASYGAVLNRAAGPNFQHIDHPDVFIPCIEATEDIEGVEWDAYSFNNGARAGLTIDLSAMATTARKDAAEGLGGYLNLDANAQTAFLAEENGGHRCGVTIINSHDGKSALSGYLTVMRTYCKNLAMRGANQQMFKVRHMTGSMKGFDVEELASGLRNAFMEAQQHLLHMAILRHLPIEMNTFDKLLTAFDRQGLITQPSVTVDIDHIKTDADGNEIKLTKAQQAKVMKITRGHAWKAVTKGWIDPDLDFVAVEEESVNTMFHAAQCMSGYLTHKPIFADGKSVLTGNHEGVETFMKKSAKNTNFFEEISSSAVKTYLDHTGQETLGLEDMADFKQYFAENPSALKVGFKSSRRAKNSTMTSIDEIPLYQDTWDVTYKTNAQTA